MLVVDDDMRNIFAINSVLEARASKVIYAENGQVALELLDGEPGRGSRPDGHDDARDGRAHGHPRHPRHRRVRRRCPIISLTAKAMKGDREKALAAGASDYVAKPVDPERLLSVVHRWITGAAGAAAAARRWDGGAG